MAVKIFICNLDELKEKRYVNKWIDDFKDELIVYFDSNNKLSVKSSVCPHFGGEIVYDKKIKQLKCLWHDWKFCEESGKCNTYPIRGKLNPYEFKVEPQPLKSYYTKTSGNKVYAIKK
tara:strand:- start:1680 stop:2033 length:354 start_codon:yes stop_codon:yes gene_type:complete